MAIQNFVSPENIKYVGKEANEIMAKPIYESDLYSFGITYMPGVKGKTQLVTGEVGELFQAYTCAFSPSGNVNLSEQWIEPKEIKINLQNCYDKFWPSFMAEETRRAYVGESNIPRTFFQWFFDDILVKEMKKEYQELFFNGDTASTGETEMIKLCDGVVKQVSEAPTSTKINGAALTTENILDQIKAVAEKASVDVDMEEYKIFLNKGQFKILLTALGNKEIKDNLVWSNFTREGDKVYAYGFEVIPCRIEKDVILLAPRKNLVLGYDLESDQTNFQILDLSQVTGDNEFRVIALCNIAVGIVYPELMVISKPGLGD